MIQYAAVILIKPDGSVLAQHRDNIPSILEPDKWGVVGGGKEESIDKDLISTGTRELLEETDYVIRPKDLYFLLKDNYMIGENLEVERTIFWAWYDECQQINCNEGQEIRFINPSEFERLDFARDSENFLRKASEKAFSADVERKAEL